MSGLEHVKDEAGNDIWFGDGGELRFPPGNHITDFKQQLKRLKTLQLRSDDVIVVGYPKTGNNWIHHMVTMLTEGTTELPPVLREDHFENLESCGGPKQLPPADKPRALWSHAPFRFLPLDLTAKKVKVVYITRNPKDVFVSMFCFLHKFDPPMGYRGTWEQFFPFMLKEGWWFGNLFDYLLDWDQEIENHPDIPVYRICYEETLRDTVGQVEKLNEFLGTNRDAEFCRKVADACSFSNIPQARQLSATLLQGNCNWKDGVPFTALYRKGVVGDWKNWFTVAQNEEFDRVYREKMADSKITFTFE